MIHEIARSTLAATNGSRITNRKLLCSRRSTEQVSALLKFANEAKDSGHGARRGFWLCRRLRAGAWRYRALARADESDQGNQFC